MGRNKQATTPAMQAEQKRKWQANRNARRRKLYQQDPEYRERINSANRKRYREDAGSEKRDMSQCIKLIPKMGRTRSVILGGEVRAVLTFNVKELAALLGYHAYIIYRWHANGRFPEPNVLREGATADQPGGRVYTEEQVRKFIPIFIEHHKRKLYIHDTDTETITKLHNAIK